MGPGGLGGTVAALLARRQLCAVTIVGRPGAHIDAIQREGLRLTGLQDFTVKIDAFDDPNAIEECDALILAVKAQHTQAALEKVAHIQVGDFVTSLQNGALKDDLLADVFGREKVVGAIAIVAGERPEPGVVKWTYDGGTQFGELDGGSSERVEYIVDVFSRSGLTAQSTDAIVSSTWTKVIGWIPIGLLASLSRKSNAGVFSDRSLATALVAMVRELSGLAAAKGIPLTDVGPYHVGSWNRGSVKEAVELVMNSPLAGSQSRHSALQDIEKGQATEFRACAGPMIEDARKNSVPVPAVEVMYAALIGLEDSLRGT